MTSPRMSRPIRLCSIDDHEIVHTGIEFMAQAQDDFDFVGALADPEDAVAFVLGCEPDIVLLDLFMRDEQGWSTCQDLVAAVPHAHIVMYSGYGNAQLVDRALRLGASGYVLKSTTVRDLPDMLRGLLSAGQCIDGSLIVEWKRFRRNQGSEPGVNDHELDIIRHIAEGLDNYAIAERMNLSFHTVKFHIGKMLRRTGEQNRAGLVRWAKERFLID